MNDPKDFIRDHFIFALPPSNPKKGPPPLHEGPRPLSVIAREVRANWTKVYFGAVPYLDAMATMDDVSEDFGCDPGREIVTYFLANANGWRGDVARRVKKELKGMLK